MSNRENQSTSVTGYNNGILARLTREIRDLGVVVVADHYGVNKKYVSEIKNLGKIPTNAKVAEALGFKVLMVRISVPHGEKKEYNRLVVYPGTVDKLGVDAFCSRLKEITGITLVPLEDEMRY